MSDFERNPLVIPDFDPTRVLRERVCPACRADDWVGSKINNVVHFKCKRCGNEWQGGLPREPVDPRKPTPPLDPRDQPRVDFALNRKTQEIEEIRRPVDLSQDFRRGGYIPPEEDDGYGW